MDDGDIVDFFGYKSFWKINISGEKLWVDFRKNIK